MVFITIMGREGQYPRAPESCQPEAMRLVDRLGRWLDALPRACLLCDRLHRLPGPLCAACAGALPRNLTPCRICAEPQALVGQLCSRCQRTSPPFARAYAPWRYEDGVSELMHRFKFHGDLRAAQPLWPALQDAVAEVQLDALVPVPVHDRRHRERGFNQALWLADRLAGRRQWPVLEALRKTRMTADQVGLSRSQRQRNLRGALALSGQRLPPRVGLVDDVLSSGATAAACTGLLKKAGAREVVVLVLARTPRKTG